MEKIYQLRNILEKAFKTEGQERFDNINFFLKEVWEDEAITDEKINDLLTDIAYDLEFYEPSNGDWSIDTSIYYDGEKMDRMLDEANASIELNSPKKDEVDDLMKKYDSVEPESSSAVDEELERLKKEMGL